MWVFSKDPEDVIISIIADLILAAIFFVCHGEMNIITLSFFGLSVAHTINLAIIKLSMKTFFYILWALCFVLGIILMIADGGRGNLSKMGTTGHTGMILFMIGIFFPFVTFGLSLLFKKR